MKFDRLRLKRWLVAGIFLAVCMAALVSFLRELRPFPEPSTARPAASSALAFAESYLDAASGRDSTKRRSCSSCHADRDDLDSTKWSQLSQRATLSRTDWAARIALPAKCGVCHLVPDPSNLPSSSWSEVMLRMKTIMVERKVTPLADEQWLEVLHFFLAFSPERHRGLDADPEPGKSPMQFEKMALVAASANFPDPPLVGHVQWADLDRDGLLDVLACDSNNSALTWIHRAGGGWIEEKLAGLPHPARAQVFTNQFTGRLDVVVACLGTMRPADDLAGRVVLLANEGANRFKPVTLLEQVSRVADVQPGDFDNDGDVDFVVAAYGFLNEGEVGWLERVGAEQFDYHRIVKRTGAANALPVDLNGDQRLDFVALFAQEHEQVSAFINDGQGGFQEHLVFRAATPAFGSSSIQLTDLDRDGDWDILLTNGDNLDLPTITPRPFHGVQWLENQGNLKFVWHDLHRCYGAYSATTADLNRDDHLDIVVTSLFNDWRDPSRASLLWLENTGSQRFVPHTIATSPTHLISAAVGDLDGDDWPDIVAGGMHGFPPFDRMGRVTLWKNHRPVR